MCSIPAHAMLKMHLFSSHLLFPSYKFAIQETTHGSNKKVYHYEGKRVKLAKPIVLELQDKKLVMLRNL